MIYQILDVVGLKLYLNSKLMDLTTKLNGQLDRISKRVIQIYQKSIRNCHAPSKAALPLLSKC